MNMGFFLVFIAVFVVVVVVDKDMPFFILCACVSVGEFAWEQEVELLQVYRAERRY